MSLAEAFCDKAQRSFDSAEVLLAAGYAEFAAARAYYAAFYVATALLGARGMTFKRHRALHNQFLLLVGTQPVFAREFHTLLARGQEVRNVADYGLEMAVPLTVVNEMISAGRNFLATARAHFAANDAP